MSTLAEAIEWAKQAPNPSAPGVGVIEIRPLFGEEDFEMSDEMKARGQRLEATRRKPPA